MISNLRWQILLHQLSIRVTPGKHFQVYAYDSHADVPASSIKINNKVDVQVIPFVFQNETSPIGLLTRWYSRHKNISEYHYLNLAQWSGETPSFSLSELERTVQRLKDKNSQGIILGILTCQV